jgi:hypothetical protein
MGAGPVPEILHRMLNGLAWLVRLRLLPSLLPFAFLIHEVTNRVRWGEHRGGMFVAVTGTDAHGVPVKRSWHLLAEGDDGPLIPSMACQAMIERCFDARRPVAGARAATADLELEDYDALFARRTIYTGTRRSDPAAATQPLYQRILGDAWDALPAPLRAMHHCTSPQVAAGQAEVLRGRHPLARLVAFAMGFPAAGQQVPLQVEFTPGVGGERWTRTFAGRSFSSFQSAGRGTSAHLLQEFVLWFLRVCLDQITFMSGLFELDRLAERFKTYVLRSPDMKPEAVALLHEALIRGQFERGEVGRITGLPERTARRVMNDVLRAGLLASETPKGAVSLRFPADALEDLFPRLYPRT